MSSDTVKLERRSRRLRLSRRACRDVGRNFCFGGNLRAIAVNGSVQREYLRELTQYLHVGIPLLYGCPHRSLQQ